VINDGAHGFGDAGHGGVLTQRRKDAKTQRGRIATFNINVQRSTDGGGLPVFVSVESFPWQPA
jgi:hypothetical protein